MFYLIETHKAQRNSIEHLRTFISNVQGAADSELITLAEEAIHDLERASRTNYQKLQQTARAVEELKSSLDTDFEMPPALTRLMNLINDEGNALQEYL